MNEASLGPNVSTVSPEDMTIGTLAFWGVFAGSAVFVADCLFSLTGCVEWDDPYFHDRVFSIVYNTVFQRKIVK